MFPVSVIICALLAAVLFSVSAPRVRADEVHDLIINADSKTNSARALKFLEAHPSAASEQDTNLCTPLHYAAQYSRTNVVKWLLKHKADVNAAAYNSYTPLFLTTNGEIAKLLIRAGADRSHRDSWGRTPLQHAAQLQHLAVANAILDSGYPLDLTSACMLGRRADAMKIIKRRPEEVKHPEPDTDLWGNTTPLGIAAGYGDMELVVLLLKSGAPVNAPTVCPRIGIMTPLCNAVWGGQYAAAEMLCRAGADCNVTGGKFYPHLLDYALAHSEPKMVDLLVQYGAKSGK